MRHFVRESLFKKLLIRALPVLLITGLVWFGMNLYFREQAYRATEVRYLAMSVEHRLHEARQAEKTIVMEDLDEAQFYLAKEPTVNLLAHANALSLARADSNILLQIAPSSELPHLMELLTYVNDYKKVFDSLIDAYRERGYGKWGIEGVLEKRALELERQISTVPFPELQRALLLLRMEETRYLLNREHMSSERVENVGNLLANLRSLLQARKLSRLEPALDAYRAAFMKYSLVQSRIGLGELSGLRKELQSRTNEIETLLVDMRTRMAELTQGIFRRFAIFSVLILLFGIAWEFIAILAVARNVSGPLRALTLSAIEIRKGSLGNRAKINSDDEIGFLATVFNETVDHLIEQKRQSEQSAKESTELANELKTTQQQLVQSQKLEAIGTLAGGIAHDFNNLLGAILSYAGILKNRLVGDTVAQQELEIIEKSAERGAELTKKLLGFARKGQYQKTIFDVNGVIRETKAILARTLDSRIKIYQELAADLWSVRGDATQILQVIMNLCINSRDAMPSGGELYLASHNVIIDTSAKKGPGQPTPGRYVLITIRDTGMGIPADIQGRVFDPFFTTKEVGKGTGLGLAMVYGIVQSHGGSVSFQSTQGEGTTFELLLPAVDETGGEVKREASDAKDLDSSSLNGKFILVADDEELFRNAEKDILEAFGATVFTAADGQEAVEFCRTNFSILHTVVLDVVMPKKDGIAAAKEILEFAPEVRIVLSSGYAEHSEIAALCAESKRVSFIQKPFHPRELVLRVLEAEEASV